MFTFWWQLTRRDSVSFWLEHFQTQSPGFENEQQGRKRQFLLLKVKKLPAYAGDLFYSSWSPVGWSGRGCHVKWLNDSRTECSCNHLTHFAVLMQFDTDSELKTGQYSRLQKVGHKTERTEVSLLGLERRVLNAHPKLFSSLFRISFFSKLASVAKFQLILLLVWQSHSVSRQRFPKFCTVFCWDPVSRKYPSRHWGKAGHTIGVYILYFLTICFPSNLESYQRFPESCTVYC